MTIDNFVGHDGIGYGSIWQAQAVASIITTPDTTIAPIDPAALAPILPGVDLWDLWPLQNADGANSVIDGWRLWFVLSSPVLADPEARHDIARIRLMANRIDGEKLLWRDLGYALPDGFSPGSREWAGSALYLAEARAVTLFWTAAGRRDEAPCTVEQRIFASTGQLREDLRVEDWSSPVECFVADGKTYQMTHGATGEAGAIKGFRDPAYFRCEGTNWLLFTGSLASSQSAWNGCVGLARATGPAGADWVLQPPLITADGLNNELERPHIVVHGGLLYLFWSTQQKVFAIDGPAGPNGLYAMVAERVTGPWRPVNGTGLVAANPANAPYQAYSWWVLHDLTVAGFADYPAVVSDGKVDTQNWRRAHYAGTQAPLFRIILSGDTARVDHSWQSPKSMAATRDC